MIFSIKNLLSKADLNIIRSILATAVESDGANSAGSYAIQVKNNIELSFSEKELARLNNLVIGRILSNSTYQQTCFPLRIAAPFYSRYKEGMFYGEHTDNPIMGQGALYRSDISISVFLSEQSEYSGGELIIKSDMESRQYKLDAGSALIYPSSTRHSVAPVTRGQRHVAVTWVQSMIRNSVQRQILSDLVKARNLLDIDQSTESISLIDHSYSNLVRIWSEL